MTASTTKTTARLPAMMTSDETLTPPADHDVPPSSPTSPPITPPAFSPPNLQDRKTLERLARSRPSTLTSRPIELGFVFTIVASMMMSEYFVSGFNIILPLVADDIGIPPQARTWPAGVINLTIGSLLMPFSRLCDRYGGRSVFLTGMAWLAVWTLACGFVNGTNVLIVCRAMQGVGAAAFLPAGLALLGQTYRPGPRKNLIFGIYGAFAVMGFYFGIIIGGLAAQFLSWRWFFWIGTILLAVVSVSGFLTIPRHLGDGDPDVKMDWWGVCTIVPGLTLLVFAFTDGGNAPQGWKTPYVYVTLILGVLLLAAAVYVQGWVSAQPLLPAELFRPRHMKRLVFALFCCYGVFGLFLFYATYYMETILHASPLQTAAWFTPMAVGGLILAVGGGFVLHLLPNRILMIISGIGFLLSVLLFAIMPAQTTSPSGELSPSNKFLFWAYIFPSMLCATIGIDITFNVTNIFITTAMPRRLQATASGLINNLLYLGVSFWLGIGELAVSVTIQTHGGTTSEGGDGSENGGPIGLREQYRIGFWTGVGLAAVALCVTATIKMAQASADMTADEKAELEKEAARLAAEEEQAARKDEEGGVAQAQT